MKHDLELMESAVQLLDDPYLAQAEADLAAVVRAGGTDRSGLVDILRGDVDDDVLAPPAGYSRGWTSRKP